MYCGCRGCERQNFTATHEHFCLASGVLLGAWHFHLTRCRRYLRDFTRLEAARDPLFP